MVADVNWNQHILLKTLVYCTVCCILPPINQACVASYNRQYNTEGVLCLSVMTSTAQNLRQLPMHSEQVVDILEARVNIQCLEWFWLGMCSILD